MRRSSALFIFLLIVSVSTNIAVGVAQNESEPAVIPVKITLLIPGSLSITFPWSDNVTASASSAKHTNYVLISRQNYVVFTTNATDNYKIKVRVSYPAMLSGSFTIRAYSHNALSDYLVTFNLNCSSIVFDVDLITAPAPKYPSAQEIAMEQSRYIQDLLVQLANATSVKIHDLLENYTSVFSGRLDEYNGNVERQIDDLKGDVSTLDKRIFQLEKVVEELSKTVSDLNNAFKIMVNDLDVEIGKLKSTLQSFQANTWTSIMIVCVTFAAGIIGAVKLSSESGPTIAEITPKGFRKFNDRSNSKKRKVEEDRRNHDFPHFAAIILILAGMVVYFIFIFVFGGG